MPVYTHQCIMFYFPGHRDLWPKCPYDPPPTGQGEREDTKTSSTYSSFDTYLTLGAYLMMNKKKKLSSHHSPERVACIMNVQFTVQTVRNLDKPIKLIQLPNWIFDHTFQELIKCLVLLGKLVNAKNLNIYTVFSFSCQHLSFWLQDLNNVRSAHVTKGSWVLQTWKINDIDITDKNRWHTVLWIYHW